MSLIQSFEKREVKGSLLRKGLAVLMSAALVLAAVAQLPPVQVAAAEENLLAGKQPVEYYVSGGGYNGAASATGGVYYINGAKVTATAARLAGLTNGVTDTANENCLHYPDNYYTEKRALVLVYDLGKSCDLAEIRLVGESGDERLGGVRLYAGDSYEAVSGGRADLFSHRVDTLADAGTDESGTVSQTLTGVTARYVAFVITGGVAAESARDSQAFLRELAVYSAASAVLQNWSSPQLRLGNPAIRFGFDMTAAGVAYAAGDGSYEAALEAGNYTRRTLDEESRIVVDGTSRVIKDFGAVLSSSSAATAEGLVCDAVDFPVKRVSAEKLFAVDGDTISFTVVVVEIPEGMEERTIYARAFVEYEVDGTVEILYGDVVTTSLKALQDAG